MDAHLVNGPDTPLAIAERIHAAATESLEQSRRLLATLESLKPRTRYVLNDAPEAGSFDSAALAVMYALSHNISPNWKAV